MDEDRAFLVPVRNWLIQARGGLERGLRGTRFVSPGLWALPWPPRSPSRGEVPPRAHPPSPGGGPGGALGGAPQGGPWGPGGAPGGGKNRLLPSPRSNRAHQIFGHFWPKKGGFGALIYIALYKSCGWVCVCVKSPKTQTVGARDLSQYMI